MLVIFGLATYSTKGVSFGGIDSTIPGMIIPRVKGFPTIILWAVAAVIVVWFIWNKTTFGKNLFTVGGNPEPRRSPVSLCSGSRWAPSFWPASCTASVPGWSVCA